MLSDLNDRIDSTFHFVEIGWVFSVFEYKIEKHLVESLATRKKSPMHPFWSTTNQNSLYWILHYSVQEGLSFCLEGILSFSIKMPQLDKFTYFTQFFWSCLFLFTFYIPICNDGDGLLGISIILKLRNQLVSHRENNIRSSDPNSLEDILRKGFSTGVSYMYKSLFEVSQWCKAVDLLGKRRKITLISCFGEISGSRGMERNIFYLISKSSYSTSSNPGWGITCRNDIMLIHVPHGQRSIGF